jgi:TonB family protein
VLAGCQGRSRTKNSGGGELAETAAGPKAANIYRFVTVEQSLADARKALQAERWAEAHSVAQALLKESPGHLEAQRIEAQAQAEVASQPHFEAFTKALLAKDNVALGAHFRGIAETSVYFDRARPDYERVREQWVVLRETEARALVHAGRCRDAHRVARSANDTFPEMRPRLDLVTEICRPAAGQEVEPELPSVAAAPVASLTAVPAEVAPAPAPAPPAEPDPPAKVAKVVEPPPPSAPPPSRPKLVASIELEKLRLAGEKRPVLPAGANMIAHRDHVANIIVGVSVCLSEAGVPTTVELVKPSGYEDADDKIVTEVRAWRFQPTIVDGRAVPVCTRLIFNYQIQ